MKTMKKKRHRYPFHVPRGLLFVMVIIPWVLMAAAWTEWADWTLIGIAGGQFLAMATLFATDDYKYVRDNKRNNYV